MRLPDGCSGLDFADGSSYTAERPGGKVDLEPQHAGAVRKGWYGQSGVMSSAVSFSFGTKAGRWCAACKRSWNAWTTRCNKCHALTEPEPAPVNSGAA